MVKWLAGFTLVDTQLNVERPGIYSMGGGGMREGLIAFNESWNEMWKKELIKKVN